MSNGLKIVLNICAAYALCVSLPVSFAQDNQLGETSGEIVNVNCRNSSLVIKQIQDETSQSYTTMKFNVEASASISKGETVMILSNLKVGDQVTIAYYTTSEGSKVARTITVMEDDENGEY